MTDIRAAGRLRGFTLIEMAIVLVVIGLILSGGLLAVAPVLENARRTETNNKLDTIEDALVLYAIQNQCLPCPADGTALDGQAEDTSTNYTTGCAANGQTCAHNVSSNGTVPWRNLGLAQADIIDGWGNQIGYQVSTNTPVFQDDGGGDGQFLRDGVDYSDVQGNITVNDTAGAAQTTTAAYVMLSYGPDGAFATSSGGTAIANIWGQSSGDDQFENQDNNTTFVQDDPVDLEGTDHFDDIVRWKTGPIIVQQCGTGACGNP